MDFLELTKKRFSARSYKSDAVEQEKLLSSSYKCNFLVQD